MILSDEVSALREVRLDVIRKTRVGSLRGGNQ